MILHVCTQISLYVCIYGELCLQGDLIMNVQSCFPSISKSTAFQDHLVSTTLVIHTALFPVRCSHFLETWTNMQGLLQYHWWAACPRPRTIQFLRSRQLKWGATWLFWSCDATVVNCAITFLKSRQLKWSAPLLLVMLCYWHGHQCYVMLTVFSKALLHSLHQDGWNRRDNFFSHVTPLALI